MNSEITNFKKNKSAKKNYEKKNLKMKKNCKKKKIQVQYISTNFVNISS